MKSNKEEMYIFECIIIEKVKQEKLEYIDAITAYCQEKKLDIESIINLISPSLKSKIEDEAISLKLVKKNICNSLF